MTGLVIICGGGCQFLLKAQEVARRASCFPNLILQGSRSFAQDNGSLFPPLSPKTGRLVYDTDICGKYCVGVSDHACEMDEDAPAQGEIGSNPSAIDDWSYVYISHFLENEQQGQLYAAWYEEAITRDGSLLENIEVGEGNGNLGTSILHRLRTPAALRDGLLPLAQRADQIPVVIEWPGNHNPIGGHVVYLDGHREYINYPGKFPMSETFIAALKRMDALGDAP